MKKKNSSLKILLLILFLCCKLVFAQNKLITVLCNIAKTEIIYKEKLIELNAEPYYKIYEGSATAYGYNLNKPNDKTLYLKDFSGFSFSENFSKGISPNLIEFVQAFGRINKINLNVGKSIYSELAVNQNPAGMIIMGVDMSSFIKDGKNKPGIYVCDVVEDDNPDEIRKKIASLEEKLESDIRWLPDIIKEKLIESNAYNKKTGLLKYDIDIIKLKGISKKLPNEDAPPIEYKNLFHEFNQQVLSYYNTKPEEVPAAATRFIEKYNFPAAYAIKARYLLSNNDFATVRDQAINLLKINRKLLGKSNINEFANIFRNAFYYGGVSVLANDTYDFKNRLDEVFYQLALVRYADKAIQAGVDYEGSYSMYDLQRESLLYLSGISGPFNIYSTITNKIIRKEDTGPVRMELNEAFKEFDLLYDLMLSYFERNAFIDYQKKSKEFKNSLQLNGLRYLINKNYDVANKYNSLGRYYEVLFASNACNADSAVYYFQKATDLGNQYAMFNLSRQYYFGTGVKQDITKAKEWLAKAKAKGVNVSNEELLMNSKFATSFSGESSAGDKMTVTLLNKSGQPINGPIVLKAFNQNGLPDTLYYKVNFTKKTPGNAQIWPNLDKNSIFFTGQTNITETGDMETAILKIIPNQRPNYFFTQLEFYMYATEAKKDLITVQVPFTVKWQ